MNKHIEIFDDIYNIKEKLLDNEYLEINNKLQKLIQENEQLNKKPIYVLKHNNKIICNDNNIVTQTLIIINIFVIIIIFIMFMIRKINV
jgi:hypothetical protein